MKKIFLLHVTIFLLIGSMIIQDIIYLKSNKRIECKRVYSIERDLVTYEKDGSLHDVMIKDIKQIITDKEIIITFDDSLKPLYNEEELEQISDTDNFNWFHKRMEMQ